MTTSNTVTRRLAVVGNGAGAVCWGGRTGSTGAGASGEQPGWFFRVRRGGARTRWAGEKEEAGCEEER